MKVKRLNFVIFWTFFCVICADDVEEEYEDTPLVNPRGSREFNKEGLRIIETFPETSLSWSSSSQPQEEEVAEPWLKRRRLRKRKRRPQSSVSSDETYQNRHLRRRIRPQNLQQMQEPWDELNDEAVRRSNTRRRVPPTYQSPDEINDELKNIRPSFSFPSTDYPNAKNPNRKEVDKSQEQEEDPQINTITDLKLLLKQSNGNLSLSEILQQKNISLAELLTGSEKAISALTENPRDVTQTFEDLKSTEEIAKYKRQPPSTGLKRNNFQQEVDHFGTLSSKEMLAAQRKRLSVLQAPKESRLFSSVTKFDVVTEETTERRIFVPSHPIFYTSLNFKPDFNPVNENPTEAVEQATEHEQMTTTAATVKTTNRMDLKPKLKGALPITNAKLRSPMKMSFREKEEEHYPLPFDFPKPIKISINEIIGFRDNIPKVSHNYSTMNSAEKNDEPLRVPIDLDDIIQKNTERENRTPPSNIQHVTTSTEVALEKDTYVTAKQEIMEIMKDPTSREKLSRILKFRNMTLDELVEQRERGYSQLHLADIFHNDTREPEPKEEVFVGQIDSNYFNNFPFSARQQKSRKFNDETNKYSSIQKARPTESFVQANNLIISKSRETHPPPGFPTIKIEVNKNMKNGIQSFPWLQLYPDLFPGQSENDINVKAIHSTENDFEDGTNDLEDVSSFYLHSSEQLDSDDNEPFMKIPSGMKSAIFVSLTIVGLSILVFLTILVIFRWTQKNKKKLNYSNSLSTKLTSPIIVHRRPTSAIKSFVNETLGRKMNRYKSNIVDYDIWASERDKNQSF